MNELENLTEEQKTQISSIVKDVDIILTKIDLHKESVKDIVKQLSEETGIPVKILNKLMRIYHKDNYRSLKDEDNIFI